MFGLICFGVVFVVVFVVVVGFFRLFVFVVCFFFLQPQLFQASL